MVGDGVSARASRSLFDTPCRIAIKIQNSCFPGFLMDSLLTAPTPRKTVGPSTDDLAGRADQPGGKNRPDAVSVTPTTAQALGDAGSSTASHGEKWQVMSHAECVKGSDAGLADISHPTGAHTIRAEADGLNANGIFSLADGIPPPPSLPPSSTTAAAASHHLHYRRCQAAVWQRPPRPLPRNSSAPTVADATEYHIILVRSAVGHRVPTMAMSST